MAGGTKRKTSKRAEPKSSVARFRAHSRRKRTSPPIEPESTRAGRASIDFPIVGIGASAGGLEAFQQLLAHLPANTGMAFWSTTHAAVADIV